MRRFLFKAAVYKGNVEAIFDTEGKLWRLNFSDARNINRDWIKAFTTRMPVDVTKVQEVFGDSKQVTVEEIDFEVLFEDFMREYPRKRNTHLAEQRWPTLTSGERYLAFLAAVDYRVYCTAMKFEERYIQLPEKFLKDRQWLNNWKLETPR